ncbi:MAG: helix-turn-helix transcriptional regulator [Eubacteriales bacterium]|nr:helix-turn-helix transcriptional regulator [Eubacteriales bacterium]
MTENMMNYEVGRQLKLWRKQKNISGNLLAKRAGLSQSTISAIEHGYKSPTVQTLDKLCSAMEISLEDFFIGISRSRSGGARQVMDETLSGLSPEAQRKLIDFLKEVS